MVCIVCRTAGTGLLMAILLTGQLSAQSGSSGHRFGLAGGIAVSGAPMGEVAERNGTFAIPGTEYEFRLLMRWDEATEWSLGFLMDQFSLGQEIDPFTHSEFDYSSTGVVVGYSRTEPKSGIPIEYRLDLGWRQFDASSSGPNYYTGDSETSRVRGDAALLAVSLGIEIPVQSMWLVPTIRLETNYPDFGGGEGRSALHRESDLGFRLSMGVALKTIFPGERR